MITKEEKELIDALSREKGEAMSPFEELTLLGYYGNGKKAFINDEKETAETSLESMSEKIEELLERIESGSIKPNIQEKEEEMPKKNWNRVEEYNFDENDEQYRLLTEVLKYNHNKTKYFA